MRLRGYCILVTFAALAGTSCAAGHGVPSSAPSSAASSAPSSATTSAPSSATTIVSRSARASAGPVGGSTHLNSPVGPSSPADGSQPQIYVTAAQLLNARDGAIVVKDCPAQGACAFRIDVTSDGGTTWRRGRNFGVVDASDNGSASMEDPIIGLTMVSGGDMFAYGSSVWHTTDAGATWVQLPGAPPVDTVATSNGDVWAGVACGDLSNCASSIDAISADRVAPLPHQPGGVVGSIVRHGPDAYAVLRDDGGVGELAVSHDDGTSWQLRSLPQKYCTYNLGPGMTITTTGVLYIVCATGASAGSEPKDLFISENGAISWQHEATLETYGYADGIVAASPDILWRYGGRAPIFNSTDAGKTWQTELGDEVGDGAGPMTQAFAASGTNAIAFAYALPPGPPSPTFTGPWTINEYRTTDAGTHWQTIPLQP